MNYTASVRDFFRSPDWVTNLLLGGVCMLIPLVGPIVLTGWLVTVFWAVGEGSAVRKFQFDEFGKYLERGIWPFVVLLVASFVMIPIFWLIAIVPMFAFGFAGDHGNGGCMAAVGFALMGVFMILLGLLFALLITPLKLRAAITQGFGEAFQFAWIRRFIALTWKEMLVSWLFLFAVNFGFACAGALIACVGMYFAMVPVYFAWMHLTKQLYALFLSRGGAPVPMSSKLAVA